MRQIKREHRTITQTLNRTLGLPDRHKDGWFRIKRSPSELAIKGITQVTGWDFIDTINKLNLPCRDRPGERKSTDHIRTAHNIAECPEQMIIRITKTAERAKRFDRILARTKNNQGRTQTKNLINQLLADVRRKRKSTSHGSKLTLNQTSTPTTQTRSNAEASIWSTPLHWKRITTLTTASTQTTELAATTTQTNLNKSQQPKTSQNNSGLPLGRSWDRTPSGRPNGRNSDNSTPPIICR